MTHSIVCGQPPRHYEAFLLDLYGTLVDIHTDENLPSLWQQVAGFAVSHGAAWEPKELHLAYLAAVAEAEEALRVRDRGIPQALGEIDLGKVFARLYAQKGVTAADKLVAETALAFRKASITHLRLYAGAKELLSALRQRGRVVLLSNAQSLFTRPELSLLGLADCFDSIYLSSEAGFKKPDPRFFRLALEREGLDPARCLMIGNDPICDGDGARRIGLAAWVIRSNISPRDLREGYDQQGMDLRKLSRMLSR